MERNKYTILSGSAETTVYHLEAPSSGPTAVVIGGMHGNERSGIQAAELVRLWTISRGDIVVIPRANKEACDRGTRQAAGEPDLNRQFPSGESPNGEVATGLWEEITRHNPDYVFDLHRSVGLYQRSPSGVGMAIYPTPSGRATASDALNHLNADHVPAGNGGFRVGNDQSGHNPLLSHKVGGDLDPPTVGWLIETTSHDQSMDTRVTQLEHSVETLLYHADGGSGITLNEYGHVDGEPNQDVLDAYDGDSSGNGDEDPGGTAPGEGLPHEDPLSGFHPRIGGSAGKDTHGGPDIDRPADMPTRGECEYIVDNADQFVDAVQTDGASIYLDSTVDLSDYINSNGTINMGSGVTIVGGYCDPAIDGRGPELVCTTNGTRVLRSGRGQAPSLWGVSFRGPELEYFDPDHTADDFSEKTSTGIFCFDTSGTFTVVGCEFRGWTLAGLETGAKNYQSTINIERSSFHHCLMEHLGYGIEHYNGNLSMNACFLDACRHAISGFGWPTCSWSLTNSVVGPGPWSGHALDMHKLSNNISDGDETAGGTILIERCSLMSTTDVNGTDQEAFALRGVPENEARIENSHFWHDSEPTTTNAQGQAYRQEWDGWSDNFHREGNIFGPNALDGRTDVGAPLAQQSDDDSGEDDNGGDDQMNGNTQTLQVEGLGGPGVNGTYSIVIHGDVELGESTEPNEAIEDISDNRKRITGGMWGGVDQFELAEDALPVSASFTDVPCRLTLDGENVTGALVGNGIEEAAGENVATQSDLDALKEWVAGQLNALTIVSNGGSE